MCLFDRCVNGLGHLLHLGRGSPPVGHIDGLMDDNALPHPCPHLPTQVNCLSFPMSRMPRFLMVGCKKETLGYKTYGELALGFYNDAVIHLPFVSSVHNLWRAKLLVDLNYGTPSFRMRDSAKVQEILVAAGKGSYAESMYEAGPQSVTQVPPNSQP